MKRDVLAQLLEAQSFRQAVAIVTDTASGDQRLVPHADAESDPLSAQLAEAFRFDRSGVVKSDDRELFIAVHNPALQLVIIGAVHIAQCLAVMAQTAGYRTIVIDPRAAFATEARFPDADVRAAWPDEVLGDVRLDARTAFVALTHDPKVDDPALQAALDSDCFYIGALGSRKTQGARLERLAAAGVASNQLERINGPIGLNLGGRGAPEIAISIVAQMTAALRLGRTDVS